MHLVNIFDISENYSLTMFFINIIVFQINYIAAVGFFC